MKRCGLILAAALVAIGPAARATEPGSSACNLPLGGEVFQTCITCHSLDGKTGGKEGPNLRGVIGRRAGELAGFPYSPALRSSGLIWDSVSLDRFLALPRRAVPGTTMSFVGLKDAAERAAVACYLEAATRAASSP